jgi:hypothetical protein
MMAAIIFVCSVAFLLQFFTSYCRSVIAASRNLPLSTEVQDATGLSNQVTSADFARVVQLLSLCPSRPEDRSEIRAVGAYYRLLGAAQASVARVLPAIQKWIESERSLCAYFAAVTLDRRIAFSRDLFAQQSEA